MAGDVVMPLPERTGADYFDINDALARIEAGQAVAFPPFEIVHLPQHSLSFCLNMARDPIQNALRAGGFFEQDELTLIAGYIKKGAHIIDIGANIGNHAIWFAHVAGAARVVVVEPNPLALAPLVANVVINRLAGVIDMSVLGVGLSDASEGGFGMKRHDRNLGATRMFAGKGDLRVHRGDDLFADETPDFMKIDVEGMEMKVLSGLSETIRAHRPAMMVEVDEANAPTFDAWCGANRYEVVQSVRHSRRNCNYLVMPAGAHG